ncbi:MAG: uracil-DNA glycosylase [Pseudomonadales bacterium]
MTESSHTEGDGSARPARSPRLEASWKQALADEFEQPYMKVLRQFLVDQKRTGKVIFPDGQAIFAALDLCPLPAVKVVIIGQDPYHGAGQAHGLCFSVQPGVPQPPSLVNIFQEINDDLGGPGRRLDARRGCLEPWARQGVLLLNAVLTVEQGRAGSHQGKGWERFTDRIVQVLNDQREHLVFMLWGSYAQRKGAIVDRARHCVLSAPHPSPLSAHRGFFGCRHFSRANDYLAAHGQTPIDWFDVA